MKDNIPSDIDDAVKDRFHQYTLELRRGHVIVMMWRVNIVRTLIGLNFIDVCHK
jgi:hypothetical protein